MNKHKKQNKQTTPFRGDRRSNHWHNKFQIIDWQQAMTRYVYLALERECCVVVA